MVQSVPCSIEAGVTARRYHFYFRSPNVELAVAPDESSAENESAPLRYLARAPGETEWRDIEGGPARFFELLAPYLVTDPRAIFEDNPEADPSMQPTLFAAETHNLA